MKRPLLAVSLALMTLLVFGQAASAAHGAGDPIGGCPRGGAWVLVDPIHQPQAADHNGDGWLCRANFFVGPGFLGIDNVVGQP